MKTKRDPFEVFLAWTLIGSLTLLALCVFVLSPAAYVTMFVLLIPMATVAVGFAVASQGGILDAYFGYQIAKGGFEIAAALLKAVGDSSR